RADQQLPEQRKINLRDEHVAEPRDQRQNHSMSEVGSDQMPRRNPWEEDQQDGDADCSSADRGKADQHAYQHAGEDGRKVPKRAINRLVVAHYHQADLFAEQASGGARSQRAAPSDVRERVEMTGVGARQPQYAESDY